MKDKKSFGKFIADKRKEKGLTQADVAGALYVTVTAVSKWERGVTYPDITLISDLCEVLEVSERELINAGNDSQYRRMKSEAERYRKISNAWFYGLSGAYLLALAVCFVCNLAVNKTLSWFFIVLTALTTAFCIFPSCSRFVKRGKLLVVSGSFTVSLLLLLLTCCLYTGGTWFFIALTAILFAYALIFTPLFLALYPAPRAMKKYNALISVGLDFLLLVPLLLTSVNGDGGRFLRGLEIAGFCFVPVLLSALIFTFVKANGWMKASCLCVVWGTFAFFADAGVSLILGQGYAFRINLAKWSPDFLNGNIIFLTWLFAFLCAVAFLVVGLCAGKRKTRK